MSRTQRTRPTRAAALIGVVIGATALAGCGAGQIAQTAEQVAAVDGANVTVGNIDVRDASLAFPSTVDGATVYPRGGSAPLEARIINTGAEADRLISASSTAASSVRITGDTEIPGGLVLVVEGAPPAAAPTTAAAPTSGATPSGGAASTTAATPTATSAPATPTTAAGADAGSPEASIVLTGLRDDLKAGLTYPVTLTFQRAGEIHVDVPVANPTTPRRE